MKVVAFNGSPKKEGNTYHALRMVADELEKEGFIYTVAAKGCFVAEKNVEFIREENLKRIEDLMQEIGRLAAACGLKSHDLIEMFRLLGLDEEE